jgi:hypothetical protein
VQEEGVWVPGDLGSQLFRLLGEQHWHKAAEIHGAIESGPYYWPCLRYTDCHAILQQLDPELTCTALWSASMWPLHAEGNQACGPKAAAQRGLQVLLQEFFEQSRKDLKLLVPVL